jgi:hypothetical protein
VDTARYFVALLLLLSVPPAVGLWYLIHPFARTWRRIGPLATYLVLTPPAAGVAWTAYLWRDRLLGADLGTRPALMALAVVAFIVGIPIAVRRRRELKERVLVGVPEMSRTDKGHLVIEGVYARTRNPRYLEFIVFVLAYVAFANYTGTWVMYVLTFPALHLVVLLEERELRDRFGAEYEEYCRRVPRYLPRRTGARARG